MKTLYESILDNDFDVNLDILQLLKGNKVSMYMSSNIFGFALLSKNHEKAELMALTLETYEKEVKPNTAMTALRQGKCVAFVCNNLTIFIASKPDPNAKSNINNFPFLCAIIRPYGADNIGVTIEYRRSLGKSWGLPNLKDITHTYLIPNKKYAEIVKYIMDNDKSSNEQPSVKKNIYNKCDIIGER